MEGVAAGQVVTLLADALARPRGEPGADSRG